MSSEEMVAKIRQKWNAALRNDANPFKPGPRVGKASLRIQTGQIKAQSSHRKCSGCFRGTWFYP